ncbi:hypothetical protein [Clostridium botulinum]|uniref:hypothetical protein n=1 Tax=Clostridium botulinum TaxID=1491 RepID=UPI0007745865|nr:hypothetical protein [Clostridium botulinum]
MKKKKFFKMVLLCLSFILCLGLFVGCSESEEDKARHYKFDVYKATTGLVEQKLTSPSTAKFQEFDEKLVQDLGGDKYEVSGYVDSENSFGAKIRWDWHCTVRIEGEGENRKIKTDDIYLK